mgnify:FL=1|tara:strand:+ start:27136 stop:27828 length:693 start_codon:yes stop_codon:yes gene_type:complete
MCNESLWLPVWQLLRQQCHQDYQLIALMIPSTGSMDEIVNVLSEQIIADKAILVGFSLGGYIASAIALKLGNKLQQLLIVSNFPKNLPPAEIKQRKRTIDWINQRGYSGIPNKRINDLLHPEIEQLNPSGYQKIKNTIVTMDRILGVEVLLHQLHVSMYRPNLLPLLGQLALPVTFLVGDTDSLVELSVLRAELQGKNNIALKEIAKTGHMLPLESPQALASMLVCFLNN